MSVMCRVHFSRVISQLLKGIANNKYAKSEPKPNCACYTPLRSLYSKLYLCMKLDCHLKDLIDIFKNFQYLNTICCFLSGLFRKK